MTSPLTVAVLADRGTRHGFGVRGSAEPLGLRRPKQIHGIDVVRASECGATLQPEADAVVSSEAGVPVGVITADCVPLLLATGSGAVVAAVHAGWRGLAAGVVEAGIDALRHEAAASGDDSTATGSRIVAAIGPHIGACCYEVDEPVLEALENRFPYDIQGSLTPSRNSGRALLDLATLVRAELARLDVDPSLVGDVPRSCTRCDALRFHSYRRDGPRAGRLVHFISARQGISGCS